MYGFIGNIGPWELAFILLVALIVVGPGKLPEVARSIGKAANEFRKMTTGVRKEFQDAMRFDEEPKKTSSSTQTTHTPAIESGTVETETKAAEDNNP